LPPAPSWAGRHVVVTGAGGFIGSHLVDLLTELGAEVTAFVRYNSRNERGLLELRGLDRELRVKYGDITELDTVRSLVQEAEVVFHLAALVGIPYSYIHPSEVVDVNTIGTLNILIAAREHELEKVVLTSTSEVYGSARFTPMGEDHPRQPQSPYSASKIAADALATSFHRSFDLPVAIARPFNTYGPRQSDRAIIPTVISQALSGAEEIVLGNLAPRRDLTFVRDTVHGLVLVAEDDASIGEEINFGNGRSISIGELAEKIVGLVGRDIPVRQSDERVRRASSEVDELVADTSKARALLGWEPEVSLNDGLLQTIEWVRANPRLYDPAVYRI
jgi:NAD dependent epimerase/dehydratase